MNGERPYEIDHVAPRLHEVFDGLIPEAPSGTAIEKERNFLTRALAAFALLNLAGCTREEAAAAIVDGGGDCGIDAVYYSAASNTLWLVQSKYIDSGRGEPDLGEVSKFIDGIQLLLQGEFNAFDKNAAWVARLPQIKQHFEDPSLRVRALLVYSGINSVSEERVRMFEQVACRFSKGDDYLRVVPYSLTSVHDWISGADEDVGVDEVQLELLNPGWLREPYETIFGLVEIASVAALQVQYGELLIAANIRKYKGETEVNERIIATLKNEPDHFFYLNNGLTAYCKRLEVHHLDRDNSEKKRIKAYGLSIVNGAQTLGSVEASCGGNAVAAPKGFVFLKVISLERCADDVAFAKRITQSTNFQNQIGSRDFAALDEQHERISLQLEIDGVSYHYKDSDDTPKSDDSNFNLDDAIKALACLEQENGCELCALVLAHPLALYSLVECYPPESLYRTRYDRLFRPDRSARTIWRAVQTRQAVIERMKTEGRAETGVRKAFFENARSLVLNLVFLQMRPEQGEPLALTTQEKAAISDKAFEIAEALWKAACNLGLVSERRESSGTTTYESARHFKSVFCSAADCQRLRNATLGLLNAPGVAEAAPTAQQGNAT